MVPMLLIGRGGSRGVPGKNTMPMLGRQLMTYPILAARHSKHVDQMFLSTEDAEIKAVGKREGLNIIDRPLRLSSDAALVEDVVVHGFEEIRARAGEIEMMLLLFCNSATITPGLIDRGIETLRANASLDSAVSVSLYNEYSPVRAMRIDEAGLVRNYLDVNMISGASCDRDTATPCYFIDCSVWILRPQCMNLDYGFLPFRWIGQRVAPLHQEGGLDIDHDYGIGHTEFWLRKHGFSETRTPYDRAAQQS